MVTGPEFALAHAGRPAGTPNCDWGPLALECVQGLGAAAGRATLGFVYVSDAFAGELTRIVPFLRQTTGIKDWVGGIGLGVVAGATEYFDRPAIALMSTSLARESYRLMPRIRRDAGELGGEPGEVGAWAAAAAPVLGIVHADPRHPRIGELVGEVADALPGFLVGGLASSRGACELVAGDVGPGGMSGVLIAGQVAVATGLSQGCSPIGPQRTISAARRNVILEIDGRPALEALKDDVGEELARELERVGGFIHVAFPVAGSDTGDYLVRNLIAIDPRRGLLAVGEEVASGERILFCRRDRLAAEEDLTRMLKRLKARTSAPPKAGLYFSCVARGPNLFGPDSGELAILRRELGRFPLIGMFCNGEISNNRLYGYTGVLALFV